jgi:hypothetical protein
LFVQAVGDRIERFCGKREIFMEEGKRRRRRETRRRYRGQTQTQYIAFGNGKEGKAEAIAEPDKSRATVSK